MSAYTEDALEAVRDRGAIVPALWLWEMANALLVAERKRRLPPGRTVAFTGALSSLPIEIDAPPRLGHLPSLLEIARTTELSAYDVAYLATALARRFPLATRDAKLRAAAPQVGVRVWDPAGAGRP